MNGAKKTTSIARKLNWHFRWGDFLKILVTDFGLILAAVCSWCFATESLMLPNNTFGAITHRAFVTQANGNLWQTLGSLQYQFGGQESFTVEAGTFGQTVLVAVCVLFGLQLLWWIGHCILGTNEIRRFLKPIDEVAQVTQSISSDGFDSEKFHSLERAIDHLNGNTPDEQLPVGDADLEGLVTAVNNLIQRMHNSYRQQVRFVDDASHELRTPIAVIQGYVNMLDRWGKRDEKVLDESISAIQTEAEHMKKLVEQLLFLARGESGRQKMQMENLSLTELLTEVCEESKMIDPDHTYRLVIEAPMTAWADVALLKQAVRILADNAAKYTPPNGGITFRLRALSADCPCIEVQDNGIGICKEDASHIFDRFYRGDPARSRGESGSGLGLAIAKWIIDKHQGYFTIKSYAEIGSRISIVLPQEPWAAKREK